VAVIAAGYLFTADAKPTVGAGLSASKLGTTKRKTPFEPHPNDPATALRSSDGVIYETYLVA
jgi:hypothetical protein